MPIDNSSRFPKPLAADLLELSEGMAIVIDGDTAPKAITAGQYLFIKNHSTLATGGYHATAAIASGADITSSNVAADTDGIVNGAVSTLNGNLANTEKHYVETNNYSLKDKGYFEITSIVSALPSGATVKSIVVTVMGYGGHLYVTGAGQENNKWYVAYVNWTGDATSVSRSVRVDIAYTL